MPQDLTLQDGQDQDSTLVGGGTFKSRSAEILNAEPPLPPIAVSTTTEELEHTDQTRTHSQTETVTLIKDAASGDVPLRIGRYRIVRLLGKGTAGSVYEAFDETLERRVAIKLQRDTCGRGDASGFQDEARTLALLEHPNIVPVYDYGVTSCGRCFVVSKLIEGTNLRDWMRRRRCNIARAVEVICDAAAALDYSHGQGVVHRDIKPANLLVDADENVFVADFGIAVSLNEEFVECGTTGSPAYMSPEQAAGNGARIDSLTDVFSLAVVLYELLTSQRPFTGATLPELTDAIQHGDPVAPAQLQNEIPETLSAVCMKGLAKAPNDRFQSAGELANAVREAFEAAAPNQTTDAGSGGFRQARWVAGVVGLLALLSGIAFLFLPSGKRRTIAQPQIVQRTSADGLTNFSLPRGPLWGLNEGEGSLFVVEDLPNAEEKTYSRGQILWSDGRRVQPLGEGIDAMTFDDGEHGFLVCNNTVGPWRRPVLLALTVSADRADVAKPIGTLSDTGEVTGLAIHPLSRELFGLEEDGTVFRVNRETGETSHRHRIRPDDDRMSNWESIAFDSKGRLFLLDDGDPKRVVAFDVSDDGLKNEQVWLMGHGADEEWEGLTIHPSSDHVIISKTSGTGLIVTSVDLLPKFNTIKLPRNTVQDVEALSFGATMK